MKIWFLQSLRTIQEYFHPLLRSCLIDANWCSSTRFLKGSDLLYVGFALWIHVEVEGILSGLYKCVQFSLPMAQWDRRLSMSSKDWKVWHVWLIFTQLTVLVESPRSKLHLWHLEIWGAQLKDRWICAKRKISYIDETEILCLEHCIWVSVARWYFNFFRIRDWNLLLRIGSYRDLVCILRCSGQRFFWQFFFFYMFERGFCNSNGCLRSQGSEMKFIFSLRKFMFISYILKDFSDDLIAS